MKSKYPIILAHGIMIKDSKFFKAFGRIEKVLKKEGYSVYTSRTDGFGTIETNAVQLKAQIEEILKTEGADKVNIIAHSKGGLDARYMIESLGMEDSVASLTTLCTPHGGSQVASRILRLPKFIKKFVAFWLNLWYRIFGDKKPDALAVCEQLQRVPQIEDGTPCFSDKVYCQSYSSVLKRGRDDFLMSIPYAFSWRDENDYTDGLVSVQSSKFGNYRGNIAEESLSHNNAICFMTSGKKKKKVCAFYLALCEELVQKGF